MLNDAIQNHIGLHTKIASISSFETGVRFGKSEAFPPKAALVGRAGTSERNLYPRVTPSDAGPC